MSVLPVVKQHKLYFICCTSRSGSTYLCQLLASTGLLGDPREFYNTKGFYPKRLEAWNVTKEQYLERVIQESETPNGVTGLKMVPGYFREMFEHVPDWYKRAEKHYVFLTREDVLRQAISLYRAEETKYWGQRRPPSVHTPVYDAARIRGSMGVINKTNKVWREWFRTMEITPYRLTYEQLCNDPDGQVRQIANYIGISLPEELSLSCQVQIQRDETTERWVERFNDSSS